MKEEPENQGDDTHALIPARSSSLSPHRTTRTLQLLSNQSPSASPAEQPSEESSEVFRFVYEDISSPDPPQLSQENSDERFRFVYEPISSPNEPQPSQENSDVGNEPQSPEDYESYSSEEELAVLNPQREYLQKLVAPIPIYGYVQAYPLVQLTQRPTVGQVEKRKWSQVRQGSSSCSDSSGSFDDEVKDLLSAVPPKQICFGTSPPKDVPNLTNQSQSPSLFLANVSPTAFHLYSPSPSKRRRETSSSDVSEATMMQRPCLDFDKMQETTLFGKYASSHGVTKEIEGFTAGSNSGSPTSSNNNYGADQSSNCLYDPYAFAFRPISPKAMYSRSYTPHTPPYSPSITPVETPPCAF